jgi:hypothetical protein
MNLPPSAAATVVRAGRLLDAHLANLDVPETSSEREWLARLLLRWRLLDEPRNAREVVQSILDQDPHPIDGLFALAEELVEVRGGLPIYKDAALWHLAGRCLDTDLIVAACFAIKKLPSDLPRNTVAALSWPSVLGSSDFLVEQVLREEIVETHAHLGGSLPGSFYWIAAMSGFVQIHRLLSWSEQQDSWLWAKKVEEASANRQALIDGLIGLRPLPGNESGIHFYDPTELPEEPFVDPILQHLLPDPMERSGYNPALGERYLLWQALALWWREGLHDDGNARGPLPQILHDYLLSRNSFIRELVHNPGMRGLDRFETTFRRQHLLFRDRTPADRLREKRKRRLQRSVLRIERFRVRHALRYQFSDPTDAPWARDHGEGLEKGFVPVTPWRPQRQVELRVTPVLGKLQIRTLWAYLQGVGDFVRHDRDAPPMRFGFVMHVHRREDIPLVRDVARLQLEGVVEVLRFVSGFRRFVVGIDAAGQELSTPPRELRQAFALVRRLVHDQLPSPGKAPIRLGRTCHAGEDFRDLMTGLRYVDEAVSLLELQPGDRIGHGLALAFDPEEWYARRPRTYPRRSDHVLDLLWGRWLARRSDPKLRFTPLVELEHLLKLRLERVLGKEAKTRESIEEAVRHFYDFDRFPHEEKLLAFLGLSRDEPPVETPIDDDYVEMVSKLRERVRKRIERAEVVFEVCPTSNMIVSGLSSYTELPYLNLNRFHLDGGEPDDDAPHVYFSINSDDPGMFQTTVSNEYRLLGQAMVAKGYRRRAVVQWLDEARRMGLASTFIPPWSPPTRQELLATLESFEKFSDATPGAVRWTELPPRSRS